MSGLLATPAGVPASAASGAPLVPASTSSSSTGQSSSAGGNGNASSGSGSSNNSNNNNLPFEKDKIWYFTTEQLGNSPSRRCGIKSDDELHYRQMTAYLIQEMGQRLQVSQLCINTAIVYMHRFYAFHSFTHFHRNSMASASLFLAAKVEEQPRKLEHVIRAANKCLPQTTEQSYADLAQELVFNENVLLQTLGFDVAIDHPHTHVVRTCQLVKGRHHASPSPSPLYILYSCIYEFILGSIQFNQLINCDINVYFSMQGSGANLLLFGLKQVWLTERCSKNNTCYMV